MDIRDLYASLTGDTKTPYMPAETGNEGFMYSDATIQRAVNAMQSAQPRHYAYMVDALEKYGPRAGVPMGNMFVQTPEAGYEHFNENILKPYSEGNMSNALMGLLSLAAKPRPQRLGVARGLLDYFVEKPVRIEDAAFEKGLSN